MQDLKAKIKCHSCNRTLQIKVKNMVPGRSQRCICGVEIKFTGDDGRKVQNKLNKFERELKKLSRQLR